MLMLSIIYILIGVLVALGVGVYLYREDGASDNGDYIPAILAGLLWPIAVVLFAINKGLDLFRYTCIMISDSLDEAEKEWQEKEADKSAAETKKP